MNGYMPNGYSHYSGGADPYSAAASANSLYSRYDAYGASAAASAYMNGTSAAYMSMYGAGAPSASAPSTGAPSTTPTGAGASIAPPGQSSGGSPYGSMQSMSPVGHASHSPGSAASEAAPPPAPSSSVPIPSGSPAPPSSHNGLTGYNLKREPSPSVGAGGPPPGGPPPPPTGHPGQQQDLNRMISMYLPGDAAAAAAGDPNAQSRIQSMYAGHYQAMMGQAGAAEHLAMAGHAHHAMSMAHM